MQWLWEGGAWTGTEMNTPTPKKRRRVRRKIDWLMPLSFFVLGSFLAVTLLVIFYPTNGSEIVLVLVGTWQSLVVAVITHWFRGRKGDDDA